MKTQRVLLCLVVLIFCSTSAHGLDWETAKRNAAEVTVANCAPQPLTEGEGKDQFLKIGKKLLDANPLVFVEAPGKKASNVADITIQKEGWVIIAAHYGYEGNTQGGWEKLRWQEKDFKKRGWQILQKTEMGGALVDGNNKEWNVFAKRLKAGENLRLVTNKYSYPRVIVLNASKP